MQTELNIKIKEFLQLSIEEITYEKMNECFSEKDTNEYGNLLHAAVQNKFDEEKVLKFIEILLDNGYDVNYKSQATGYNFIQLALYGYTSDTGADYSYSQEFILKLIKLAKEHNLDVNTKDNDGDSIVHTAMASEVYTGKFLPILDALGEEFDINCTDKENNNLTQALELYMEEAMNTNEIWYNRLYSESKDFSDRYRKKLSDEELKLEDESDKKELNDELDLESKSEEEIFNGDLELEIEPEKEVSNEESNLEDESNKEELKEELVLNDEFEKSKKIIFKEINDLIENLNFEYIINNKTQILLIKSQMEDLLTLELPSQEKTNLESVWSNYKILLQKTIKKEISNITKINDSQILNDTIKILREYNYQEELTLIQEKLADTTNKATNQNNQNIEKIFTELLNIEYNDLEILSKNLIEYAKKINTLIAIVNTIEEMTKNLENSSIDDKTKTQLLNFDTLMSNELQDIIVQKEQELSNVITKTENNQELNTKTRAKTYLKDKD